MTQLVNDEGVYKTAPELLKADVVKSQNYAKFTRICSKFRLLRAKFVKQALCFMILTQSDSVLKIYSVFIAFLVHFFALNFN